MRNPLMNIFLHIRSCLEISCTLFLTLCGFKHNSKKSIVQLIDGQSLSKPFKYFGCIVIAVCLISTAVFANSGFSDVATDSQYYKYISKLKELNITSGIGNNKFGPTNNIKLNEYAELLSRVIQVDKDSIITMAKTLQDGFNTSAWSSSNSLFLSNSSSGSLNTKIDGNISRDFMVMLAIKALGYESIAQKLKLKTNENTESDFTITKPFDDADNYIGYLALAKKMDIISALEDNNFKPKQTATREQAAELLIRIYDKISLPISNLHSYYAIKSANQMKMINNLSSVSFGWSRLENSTQLILNTSSKNDNGYFIPTGFQNPIAVAQAKEIPSLFMVTTENIVGGVNCADSIITNTSTSALAVSLIVDAVNKTSKDNMDVSFNGALLDFDITNKNDYNEFLKKLKKELFKTNKLLYVVVPANNNSLYDYKTIGEIADMVIVKWQNTSSKTPSPIYAISDVYSTLLAVTDPVTGIADKNKISIQFSFNATQWKNNDGNLEQMASPSYETIRDILLTDGTVSTYSASYQSPFLSFKDQQDQLTIWYEDSRSIAAKVQLAKLFNIQSISLWRIGVIPDLKNTTATDLYLDVWNMFIK